MTSFSLQDLINGILYYACVASISDTSGKSELVNSTPKFMAPISLPNIKLLNKSTLAESFIAPSDFNRAVTDHFVVASSKNLSLSSTTKVEAKNYLNS